MSSRCNRPWSANMPADHYLVLWRTIDGRKQGRRFKAASANKTQRVRTDCFVRMQGVSDKDYGRHTSVLIFRRPLCHLYIYNLHSGSLKPHLNVILAITVSYLGAKTSQWSRQNVQKCSDARFWAEKRASKAGRRHFVREARSDARKSA